MSRPPIMTAYRLGTTTHGALLRSGVIRHREALTERGFVTAQYAMVYIHAGEGWFEDERRRRYPLAPGCVAQRFPSRRHSLYVSGQSVRAFVAVPCQVYELFLALGLADPERPVLALPPDDGILDWIVAFTTELAALPEGDLVRGLARMQGFMADILFRAREDGASARHPGWIAESALRLAQDPEISLPALARELGVGYAVFRKRFRAVMGVSPGEYRIRRRMERAMELLATGLLPVKDIARTLGYPSIYPFSAQFRKATGISPTAFRAAQQT